MKRRILALLLLVAGCGFAWAGGFDVTLDPDAEGGGGFTGDTLATTANDTIGPAAIGGCGAVYLYAQWSGDSANVTVERSIDGYKWYEVSALAEALAGIDDSITVAYNKVYKAVPDTGTTGVYTYDLAPYLRMIISNGSVAADSIGLIGVPILYVKGGIKCVD